MIYSMNPPLLHQSSSVRAGRKTAVLLFGIAFHLGASALHGQSVAAANDAAPSNEVVVLSPFEVTSTIDRGYGSRSATGASRIALSLLETSASVVTLNETFMKDAAMVDARDVLPFVSGVQVAGSATVNPGQVEATIRGYTSGISMRDGLPASFAAGDVINQEGASDARIEVIKGPAGTLYGAHSMGGIINVVSKWPEFTRKTRVELQAQTFDEFVRAVVDTTGPIGEDTAYRVILSQRVGWRFTDEKDDPNDFFAPNASLMHTWDGGKAWARFRYLNLEIDRGRGAQFLTGYLTPGATVAPVVTNPVFGSANDVNTMPEDDVSKANIVEYEGGMEQALNRGGNPWTIRLVARYTYGRGDTSPSYSFTAPVPVNAQGQIVTYVNQNGVVTNGNNRFVSALDPRVADWRSTVTVRDFIGSTKNGGLFMDLVGSFQTGFLKHKLLVTSSFGRSFSQRGFFFWGLTNPANTTAVANSFSMVRLDPGLAAFRAKNTMASPTGRQFNAFQGENESTFFSGGVQDNISLLDDRLILTAGARYDNAHLSNQAYDPVASLARYELVPDATKITNSVAQDWSFKVGGVYKVTPGLSVFGQVSETFTPITSINSITKEKNPNQNGQMKEAGVNAELFDARLVATASVFDMELTNVLITVPNPPELGGGTVSVPAGVQKTKGFEVDVSVQPVKGLNLMLAYSDLTSKNATGGYFRNVPIDPTWSLFARYEFQQGALKNWFVGANVKRIAKQAGDAANTFFIDNTDDVGALIGYKGRSWSAQVNVYNLLDSDDVISAVSELDVFRAFERSYRLTLRYEF